MKIACVAAIVLVRPATDRPGWVIQLDERTLERRGTWA